MAYEKKTVQEYIAETDDKTVEGFNDNQETRIKAGFDNITDYVVEQGSNYTKWNSGKYEVWFEADASIPGNSTLNHSISHSSVSAFTSGIPETVVLPTLRASEMLAYDVFIARAWYPGSGSSVRISVANTSSTEGNITVMLYIIGRWK